jgi:hypothetical protein
MILLARMELLEYSFQPWGIWHQLKNVTDYGDLIDYLIKHSYEIRVRPTQS